MKNILKFNSLEWLHYVCFIHSQRMKCTSISMYTHAWTPWESNEMILQYPLAKFMVFIFLKWLWKVCPLTYFFILIVRILKNRKTILKTYLAFAKVWKEASDLLLRGRMTRCREYPLKNACAKTTKVRVLKYTKQACNSAAQRSCSPTSILQPLGFTLILLTPCICHALNIYLIQTPIIPITAQTIDHGVYMVTVTTRSSKNLSKRTQVYEESEYCLIATFQFTPLIIISASVYY